MNKRVLYALSIVVIITACSKEKPGKANDPLYVGTWQWLKTDGGIAHHILETPASTGKQMELKLARNNKYFLYTNGALTSEGTYAVETRKCIHDNTNKTYLNFSAEGDQDMLIEQLDCEIMDLSDEANDGVVKRYANKFSSL